MHIFACFIHVRQSVSCLNDWRILGHVFEISLGRPTRGIIQPVQELLFAPITDQRADKMSRIIMPKFNKVKKSYEGNGIHYFQREVAKKYSKNIIMNSKTDYFHKTSCKLQYVEIFCLIEIV